MVHLQLPDGPAQWPEPRFLAEATSKRIDLMTQVSLDGGATWVTALVAVQQLKQRGDSSMAILVPVHVEPFSLAAGYVALLTFFFFGGPVSFVAALFAWDTGPKFLVRLAALPIALLLGPLPPALLGWLGLKALKKDSSLRGKGRAVFALVVAGVLTLPVLAGVVFLVIR